MFQIILLIYSVLMGIKDLYFEFKLTSCSTGLAISNIKILINKNFKSI